MSTYQCYLHNNLLKSYYSVSSVSDLYLHIITKFWIRCYPYICLRLAAQKVIPTLHPGALFRAHIQKRESRIIADRVNTLKDHVYDITGGCLPILRVVESHRHIDSLTDMNFSSICSKALTNEGFTRSIFRRSTASAFCDSG